MSSVTPNSDPICVLVPISSSLNRFWLVSGQSESASHDHQTRNQQTAKGKLVTSWSRVLDLRHSLPPSSTYFSSVHISVRSPISLFNLTPSWLMQDRRIRGRLSGQRSCASAGFS